MNTLIYKGLIKDDELGDNYSTIFIGSSPVIEELYEKIEGSNVIISYYISNKEMTADELVENGIKVIVGAVEADYSSAYSEYTGYLWTDQELKIGGHNLLQELQDNVGKYIHMKIIIN